MNGRSCLRSPIRDQCGQWELAERIVRGQSLDAIAILPWTQREYELYEPSDMYEAYEAW